MIKLLVVDDSALMRRLLGGIFTAEGDFELAFARDGREALDILHAFKPDVVTLDVTMPHMDGLACLDRIMLERPSPGGDAVDPDRGRGGNHARSDAAGGGGFRGPNRRGRFRWRSGELTPHLVATVRAAGQGASAAQPAPGGAGAPAGGAGGDCPVRRWARRRVRRKRPAPPPPSLGQPGGVLLVGSSTGGPPALDTLLSALPAQFPWPVLIAQHMPAAFTGPLARRLDRLCSLTVTEVTRPQPLVAGQVYIGRGNADIVVAARPAGPVVMAAPASAEHRWHPSVDRLVTTAIDVLGAARLVGVLMTGMGDDGAAAMTRLRAEGGHTIAESEDSAVVWGMPGALVKAGGAGIVLPLDAIAPHPARLGGMTETLSPEALRRICDFLYRRTGMEYGEAKRYYIERRVTEQMTRAGAVSFAAYLALVQADAAEAERLINSFTVNETYFYREAHQLRCLSRALLPEIAARRRPGDLIRIWSVPCSTGGGAV